MKRKRIIYLVSLFALGIVLSACTGGTGQANSWPGLTIEPDAEVAYLAYGTHVYAIDLKTGSEIINARFPKEPQNATTFYAAPALSADGQLFAGSYDFALYSFDSENGNPASGTWPFDESENRYIGGALVNGEMVYAPSSDNNLYAVDFSGNQKWAFSTEDALWGTPVSDGEIIYLPGMDHRVYAIDAGTGTEVWQTESLGGSIASAPTLGPDGQLFIGTFGNELLGLDRETGEVIGNMRFSTNNWVWSSPTISEDKLYFGDLSGTLYALEYSAESFRELWRFPRSLEVETGLPQIISITSKPVVVGDVVFFGSESGFLFAIDKDTGEYLWSRELSGPVQTDLVNVDDRIYVAAMGKEELLYGFGVDGSQLWPPFIPRDN